MSVHNNIEDTQGLETKYNNLKQYIRNLGSVAVAYSGGFDSTFLLKVCHDVLGDKTIAVSIRTDLQPAREYVGSDEFVKEEGIQHYIINFDGYEKLECFIKNPPDRCYFCKKEIFLKIIDLAGNKGIVNIVDGSNIDDMGDFRPGMKAVKELNIKSPLKEAGMSKSDIRILSKRLGLHTWNRLSPACMASRFPYGTAVTPDGIAMLNKAEQCLLDLGFNQFRVRYHGEVARIEILDDEINRFFDRDFMKKVSTEIKKAGFTYVSLDLDGYRVGSMNDNVENAILKDAGLKG